MIGMSAKSHPAVVTGAALCCRFAAAPVPSVRPKAMKPTNAATFSAARMLVTVRPGPTPTMCTRAATTIAELATSVWTENVSGTYGTGMTKSGAALAVPGMKRSRYSASTIALAAIAPEKPATNEVQPVRNPANPPYASRR